MSPLIVLSTASHRKEARKLTQILLKKRVAACVSISAPVESHYWWRGKKNKGSEVMLIIKTTSRAYPSLERALRKYHSYSTPEILALPVKKGSPAYLKWLSGEVRPA